MKNIETSDIKTTEDFVKCIVYVFFFLGTFPLAAENNVVLKFLLLLQRSYLSYDKFQSHYVQKLLLYGWVYLLRFADRSVLYHNISPHLTPSVLQQSHDTVDKPSTSSVPTDTNIMNTLLVHESKSALPSASAAIGGGANSDKSDDSDMEDVAANNAGGFLSNLYPLFLVLYFMKGPGLNDPIILECEIGRAHV